MAGYCTLVLYLHLPAAHENAAAHSCNIQPYYLLTHQTIYQLMPGVDTCAKVVSPDVCIIDCQVLFFFISIRAEASLHRLAELNPYVTVATSTQPLHPSSDLSFLRAFQVPLY